MTLLNIFHLEIQAGINATDFINATTIQDCIEACKTEAECGSYFTQKVHPKGSPKKFTQKVYPKSPPKKFTREVHKKISQKKFTKKFHQKVHQKKFTRKVH